MNLVYHLHNQGIACVGNALASRFPNRKMRPDAVIKKTVEQLLNCGLYSDDVELRAMRWFNNRGDSLITT